MASNNQEQEIGAAELEAAFIALKPLLQSHRGNEAKPKYSSHSFESAFAALAQPLLSAKARGGLINPWAIVGLRREEVRNAAALAGLWMFEFGGAESLKFLAEYLVRAIPEVNWHTELQNGYRVDTEQSPLGDRADRVDLIVESSCHLIGIELKIDAGLGWEQLERYVASINRRGVLHNLKPHVILLAPRKNALKSIRSTSWRDVARAAGASVNCKSSDRNFVQHFIASFGEHVRDFT